MTDTARHHFRESGHPGQGICLACNDFCFDLSYLPDITKYENHWKKFHTCRKAYHSPDGFLTFREDAMRTHLRSIYTEAEVGQAKEYYVERIPGSGAGFVQLFDLPDFDALRVTARQAKEAERLHARAAGSRSSGLHVAQPGGFVNTPIGYNYLDGAAMPHQHQQYWQPQYQQGQQHQQYWQPQYQQGQQHQQEYLQDSFEPQVSLPSQRYHSHQLPQQPHTRLHTQHHTQPQTQPQTQLQTQPQAEPHQQPHQHTHQQSHHQSHRQSHQQRHSAQQPPQTGEGSEHHLRQSGGVTSQHHMHLQHHQQPHAGPSSQQHSITTDASKLLDEIFPSWPKASAPEKPGLVSRKHQIDSDTPSDNETPKAATYDPDVNSDHHRPFKAYKCQNCNKQLNSNAEHWGLKYKEHWDDEHYGKNLTQPDWVEVLSMPYAI